MQVTHGLSWIDGERGDSVPLTDRAWQYGDGVFRTLLVWRSQVQQLDAQLNKLLADAGVIGLIGLPPQVLREELMRAAQALEFGVLRMSISAGDSVRGYARGNAPLRRVLRASGLPGWPTSYWQRGIHIASLDYAASEQPALAGIKHLNRLDQVMARRLLPQACQEGLILDQRGAVLSGVMSNVFWFQDGCWHTPALHRSGVAGLMRSRLLKMLEDRGFAIRHSEQSLDRTRARCEKMLFCNSLIGVWPVRSWDGRELPFWEHGELEDMLDTLDHPYRGQETSR